MKRSKFKAVYHLLMFMLFKYRRENIHIACKDANEMNEYWEERHRNLFELHSRKAFEKFTK